MLSSIIEKLALAYLFTTPYPYIVIFAILTLIVLYSGAFIRIKNECFGVFLFICVFFISVGGFLISAGMLVPEREGNLHGEECYVKRISRHYILRLDNGESISIAGIATDSNVPVRVSRRAVNALGTAIDEAPVTLDWSSEMDGYQVTTKSGTDLGSLLVENGYAMTNSLASAELRDLEEKARSNRLGCWLMLFSEDTLVRDYSDRITIGVGILAITSILLLAYMSYEPLTSTCVTDVKDWEKGWLLEKWQRRK